MKKETIEEAAGNYSGKVLGLEGYPNVDMKHKAFLAGADWRIKKAWHDNTEVPEEQEEDDVTFVLLKSMVGDYKVICFVKKLWIKTVMRYNVESWAYINDLIPEKS